MKHVRVICPTCHELMLVDLEERPQTIACTYCEARVPVPSREMARQQFERERPLSVPQVEGYSLEASGPPDAPRPKKDGKQAKSNPEEKTAAAKTIVTCPTCHERMQVVPQEKPGRVACSYCGTSVLVPPRDLLEGWQRAPIQPRDKKTLGSYSASPPLDVAPLRTGVFDRMAEIRREKPVSPPNWTFFSGVFFFPWSPGAVIRWGWMALGFTLLSVMIGGLLLVSGAVGGQDAGIAGFGVVGLGFMMLPLIWISLMTLSYAADCCLRVLESTAYGLDRVESWPEGGWKEWMPNLIYLSWIAALPVVLSYGVARLAEVWDVSFWPVMLGTLFVLYPIALMSALEANSVWVPLTRPVIRSLFVSVGAWLIFLILTGLIGAALAALVYFGLPVAYFGTLIALGLFLPAALMIYARLMGRLAWMINRTISL